LILEIENGLRGAPAEHKAFSQLITGRQAECLRCHSCQDESKSESQAIGLCTHIPQEPKRGSDYTLSELIGNIFQEELLDGSNKYLCSKENSYQRGSKWIEIKDLPEYLIITMNRFQWSPEELTRKKTLTFVHLDETIDMDRVIKGGHFGQYYLYAMIVHIGDSIMGGHYITLARDDSIGGAREWLVYNDTLIYPLSAKFADYSTCFKYFLPLFLIFLIKKKTDKSSMPPRTSPFIEEPNEPKSEFSLKIL
jgi:ubiquitin C-terminal hydrolase